nr:ribonuclease H-like domain-containing protein [Tanacetum cinerariifolium]
PPSITRTFMPTSSNSVLEETQVTFGSKSPTSINTFESNEFVSCDNSDKSSESETRDFASYVSSPTTTDSISTVDVKILPKSGVTDPSPLNGVSSCSIKENVKPPSDLCNKRRIAGRNNYKNNFVRNKTCFVCGSKYHLIKDCHVYDTVDNFFSVVLKAASVPAGSRNSSASTTADRFIPAASKNRSASIYAGRSIPAASRNRSASIHAGIFIPAASRNRPASIHAGRSIPAASRNRLASIHAGRSIPAASRNRPASIHAGRSIPAASRNRLASIHAGRHIPASRSNKPAPFSAGRTVHPHVNKDIRIVDSGCSRSMTGNKEKLADFMQVKGGTITFGGGDVLSKEFQLPDESQVVLRIPRRHDLYTFNLSDIQPEQHINCLLEKASLEESTKWHRRMAHVNFKTINKFCWAFFLGTKDETFYILKDFIALIENQLNKKVKAIKCDNGTEFQNAKLISLCGEKGIKRDYSNVRTPQQNGVVERKNRTLIEAARSMLADSKLPTIFWTEAVSTALTILNTSDHLGNFEGKANDGFLIGYAAHSKAYRVYNLSSKKVEETLNLRYLEDKPNVQGMGQEWYFDLDYLTDSLGYTRFKTNTPVGTDDTNILAGTQADDSDSGCDEQRSRKNTKCVNAANEELTTAKHKLM